eukprot:GSMAST32.ASY1.ANO1.2265.1 assembled CDS
MDKIRKEKRIQRLRRRLTTTDFLGRRADDFYDYATASSHATWISDTRNDKTGQDLITASSYLRCKATHRCPWARVEYDVQGMKYEFTKKAFNTGRWDSIPLFTDFEDWYAGTHGWLHSPDKWRSSQQPSISRGLNPNDFVSSGKLLVNTKVTMHFVTSGAIPTLTIGTTVFNGVVATTTSSTKVALFNFDSISISKQVSITAEGNRALVISSKSTIIFDTTFTILPGTLGGFPGTDGSPSINNVTGPGSGSIRLYLHTITTSADDIDEVQIITTSADSGQNLGGTFTLTLSYCERSTIVYDAKTKESCTVLNKNESDAYKWISKTTQKISHDSSALLVSKYLGDLSIISSKVRVGRNISDQQGGHVWRVTFVDAVGDVPQIQPTSYLTGIGAKIETDTYEEGNNIGGSFSIDFLQGTTRSLPYDVSAEAMATALMEDIELVKHARVSRLDPYTLQMCSVSSSRCQGGGPMPSYGYKWSITTTTTSNNISPTSPTSSNIGEKGQKQVMTIKDSGTSLTGIGVSIKVDEGHTLHNSASLHSFSTFYPGDGSNEKHFSLAFGGSGGSYGGLGGKGHSHIDVGPMYGDVQVPDIFGGSSGTVGGIHPREVISAFSSATDNPTGVGGDGGGAIAFVAVNDIIFDVNTNIEVNGKEGGFGYRGGGGGSGGTIIIEAGGSIRQHGRLSAKGGDGGGSVLSDGNSCLAVDGCVWSGHVSSHCSGAAVATNACDGINITTCENVVGCTEADPNTRSGSIGSVYTDIASTMRWYIDSNEGAMGTTRSLKVVGGNNSLTASNVSKTNPIVLSGPRFLFPGLPNDSAEKPERVSFFIKLGQIVFGQKENNWGGYVAIHGANFQITSESMIGIGIVNSNFLHGANFAHAMGFQGFQGGVSNTIKSGVDLLRWYKIDIYINWKDNVYDVMIDDEQLVFKSSFVGTSAVALGVYNYHSMSLWIDEVYVGPSGHVNSWHLPEQTLDNVEIQRPTETNWANDEDGAFEDLFWATSQFISHIGDRDQYKFSRGGLLDRDGEKHRRFFRDYVPRTTSTPGGFDSGVLLYVPTERLVDAGTNGGAHTGAGGVGEEAGFKSYNRTSTQNSKSGKFYWYGEHQNPAGVASEYHNRGGIGACSTTDFIHWENEGEMLHYSNISDPLGLFPPPSSTPLQASKPKVLYNPTTKKYVMWTQTDDAAGTLGFATVASSFFPNGPFVIESTFFPNGNVTKDQTIFKKPGTDEAYLARTYYATVDYLLPQSIMQPLWESVRKKGTYGDINFGLNYHRAFYHPEYDDYHDTYVQRWRQENILWKVNWRFQNNTIDWLNKGTITIQIDGIKLQVTAGSIFTALQDTCFTYALDLRKELLGQGSVDSGQVESKFFDPGYSDNNAWKANSVPAVKSQTWQENYLDGNIADNPPHSTKPDKLIGPTRVVEWRRTKYVAVSKMTSDYLGLTSELRTYEGDLTNNDDMSNIFTPKGQFNFDTDATDRVPGSPFNFSPASDWYSRFHQYRTEVNDRRNDPVNFSNENTAAQS